MHFSKLLAAIIFSISFAHAQAHAGDVTIDVTLSPAGSFKAETKKVSGTAQKTADGVVAENVVIDASSLTTGISLRDDHLKKRLLTGQFPQVKLVKAVGKNGKGKGIMEIMGKKKNIEGTYKIEGNQLNAEFNLSLQDLEIKDVRYMTVGVKDKVTIHVNLPLASGGPVARK